MTYLTSPLSPKHDRTGFRCGIPSLDAYSQTQVSQDMKKKLAACFVIMDHQNQPGQGSDGGRPLVWQIRIKGHLGEQWAEWFGGLAILLEEDGHTLLTGPLVDQAALHGILKKIRNLGMPLVSVNLVGTHSEDTSEFK